MKNYWIEQSKHTEPGYYVTEQCWNWDDFNYVDTIKEKVELFNGRVYEVVRFFSATHILTSPEISCLWESSCSGFYPCFDTLKRKRIGQCTSLFGIPIFKINELKDLLLVFYLGGIVTIEMKNLLV